MVAFVLGGGGQLGAHEVGMLRALLERGIVPSLVVGTSVGAINGAAVATEPSVEAVARLGATWSDIERRDVFGGSLLRRIGTLARTGTHLHDNDALRATLTEALPIALIEDLPVRFECVAASIEAAAEHWFTSGPIVDAVLASAAVPGILPPVEAGMDPDAFLAKLVEVTEKASDELLVETVKNNPHLPLPPTAEQRLKELKAAGRA